MNSENRIQSLCVNLDDQALTAANEHYQI